MKIHRIDIPLIFSSGLSAGERTDGNSMIIAKDGQGRPVLRGSAIAGALRQAWRKLILAPDKTENDLSPIFGTPPSERKSLKPSQLKIADCLLDCGASSPDTRTHNAMNRHTGTVLGNAIVTLEAAPPGTKTHLTLWLHDDGKLTGNVVNSIASIFKTGILFGGRSNRGIGLAELESNASHKCYDLKSIAQHGEYLNDHRKWRQGLLTEMAQGNPIDAKILDDKTLRITLNLKIPRGQDLLIGSGKKDKGVLVQRVFGFNGMEYFPLWGSSLRGIFRSWISRLAAKENKNIAHSLERHKRNPSPRLDDVARGFLSSADIKNGMKPDCVVCNLFGSLAARRRIHMTDSFMEIESGQIQNRKHVAVDYLSGGAKPRALFGNEVVVANASSIPFQVRILVDNPSKEEANWIASTIQALDVGVVRVGSNKASGRLCLAQSPDATGPNSDLLKQIKLYQRPKGE